MIRAAVLTDVDALVQMGLRMRRATAYVDTLVENPDQMRQTAANLIEHLGVVLVAEIDGQLVGMIGLVLYANYLSGVPCASEAFFWVEADHRGSLGVRLLKAAQTWASQHGAHTLTMVQPVADPRVGRLYAKLGFEGIEVAWAKELVAA